MIAGLRAVLALADNPEMRRLQLAWAAMSFSLWSFAIALGVYAFEFAGVAAVGIAAFVRLLPGALASPFAGLLGDRHSRRLVLVASSVGASAILVCAAAGVATDAPVAVVFALAGLLMVVSSPYVPAEGALLPAVARTPQELTAANVAHSAMDNAGFLAGSAATGLLLALTGVEMVFGAAALMAAVCAVLVARLRRDRRPEYAGRGAGGVMRETAEGLRAMVADRSLRLITAALTLLVFFEGAIDVLVVIVALDLLGLGEGSVGFLNAAWGVGALAATAPIALLLHRGGLTAGLVIGCMVAGASTALPAAWVVPAAAYLGWIGIGAGYTFVEVAARTLMQRLGSDETLARVLATLETSRLAAMALGSIVVPLLIALLGVSGATIALAAILPLFALTRWAALRSFELGTPVDERHFALLRGNRIFAPLPVDTLERLANSLVTVTAEPGAAIITEGERGDRFYLIASGEVEVFEGTRFRRREAAGECFGEIALLRDVARTATVRACGEVSLLALERDHFLAAVTGHRRSRGAASEVIEGRFDAAPVERDHR